MSTVEQIARERWSAQLPDLSGRMAESGWSYEETVPEACRTCDGALHVLGKPYTAGGRSYRYAVVVCPSCKRAWTLTELGLRTRRELRGLAPQEPVSASEAHNRVEGLPNLFSGPGLTSSRAWTVPSGPDAEAAACEALARVAAVATPGRGSVGGPHVLEGTAGRVWLATVEHERCSWRCTSSEIRVVTRAEEGGETSHLHVVTHECFEHDAGDGSPLTVGARVIRNVGVTVMGVDPFRIGHTSRSTVDALVSRLTHPARTVPVVLFSGRAGGERAREVVARAHGGALVATIDGDASWRLSELLGAGLGCYSGAVRVYPPSMSTSPPVDSPVWVSRKVAQLGWPTVCDQILALVTTWNRAPRRSWVQLELEKELTSSALERATRSVEELKNQISTLGEKTGSAEVDASIDALFDDQAKIIESLEAERDALLLSNMELEERLDQAEAQARSLREALPHGSGSSDDLGEEVSVALVDTTVDDAIERLGAPDGPLVATENALRSWRDSRYPDPERMLGALRRLERAAVEWRAADAQVGERLGDWLQELTGLRFAGSDHGLERHRLNTFEFEGRRWSRVPHIKVDDAKHSNQVGRIYFAIDSSARRWIIDHVGQKLYGR